MPPVARRLKLGAIALGLAVAALWLVWPHARVTGAAAAGGPVGLFTTLPIMWNEAPDVRSALHDDAPPHWARAALSAQGVIEPLDTLAGAPGRGPLDHLHRLVMAQPRPLSPQENVALDQWVRAGGQLLLLADPALTEDSSFAIGDPRRPQSVVLLSPILRRWGLELQFDEAQPFGEQQRMIGGVALPVNLPGHFRILAPRDCAALGDAVAVRCSIGKGQVIALADAALLEREDAGGNRARALGQLLNRTFAAR